MTSESPSEKFQRWAAEWLTEGRYAGESCTDIERRIARVVELWRGEIPPGWERDEDEDLLSPVRDRRKPESGVPSIGGEHELEIAILGANGEPLEPATCLGGELIDGFNAVKLTTDSAGGKFGNVEGDLLLLTNSADGYRQLLLEVKTTANQPFYALVEVLRQLKLFQASPEAQQIFPKRNGALGLQPPIPVTAAVLAPPAYYEARHKKRNAVAYAEELIKRLVPHLSPGTVVGLSLWDPSQRTIRLR